MNNINKISLEFFFMLTREGICIKFFSGITIFHIKFEFFFVASSVVLIV